MCSICYPNESRFGLCWVCEEPTSYFSNVEPDEDWQYTVGLLQRERGTSEPPVSPAEPSGYQFPCEECRRAGSCGVWNTGCGGREYFVCAVCQKKFPSTRTRDVHVRAAHEGPSHPLKGPPVEPGYADERSAHDPQVRGDVFWWRANVLREAGYAYDDALYLAAMPEVDLHRATDLLARGCDPETAARILG